MKMALLRQYVAWIQWHGFSHPRMKISYKPVVSSVSLFLLAMVTSEALFLLSPSQIFHRIILDGFCIAIGATCYYSFVYLAQKEFIKIRPDLTRLQRNLIKRDLKLLHAITCVFMIFMCLMTRFVALN